MREIKFRAWDKQEGCWLDKNHAFDYAAKETKLIYCDIEGVAVGNDTVYLLDECGNWEYLSRDRFELMQFTGLHDKNGKEVFEGDIVNFKEGKTYHYGMPGATVEYYEGAFFPFADREDNAPYPYPEECEVIGNIYENPNLIEKEGDAKV